MNHWYYAKGQEQIGPVSEDELSNLFSAGAIDGTSFVWRNGFENWENLSSVEELAHILATKSEQNGFESVPVMPPALKDVSAAPSEFPWDELEDNQQVITIKIGHDRGGSIPEAEYGPFSIAQLKRAYAENRINEKTYAFTPGMDNWELLGDLPVFSRISPNAPKLTSEDRRHTVRKPITARIFFHDNSELYEGICRDVSIGGMQILVSNFPAGVGEEVTLNVHLDNQEESFSAVGVIVRLLHGNQGFSLRFSNLSGEAINAINGMFEKAA